MEFIAAALILMVAAFMFWRDRPSHRLAPPRVVRIPGGLRRNPDDMRAERDWFTDPANPLSPLNPVYWD